MAQGQNISTNARSRFQNLERELFRRLNQIVEPAVRRGIGSPRFLPSGLILLESTGFKSGKERTTPLLALRLPGHFLVATYRGRRSYWVQNLIRNPEVSFWSGARQKKARAFVMTREQDFGLPASAPLAARGLNAVLAPYTLLGWTFSLLAPQA